jgi:DNA recombination protein RmuC
MHDISLLLSMPIPPMIPLILLFCCLVLLVALFFRSKPVNVWPITSEIQLLGEALERVDRSVKDEISRNRAELTQIARGQREELSGLLERFGDGVLARHTEMAMEQRERFGSFTSRVDTLAGDTQQRLDQMRESANQTSMDLRKEVMETVGRLAESVGAQMDVQIKRQVEQADGLATRMTALSATVETQLARILESTAQKTDQMRETIATGAASGREEMGKALQSFGDALDVRMARLTESNEQKMEALRLTVEGKLVQLRQDNEIKLEAMRKTVDEHLHGALEKRLGESFKLVSDRLEQVHKGLGEMQALASGVGDLKRVLTNVKSRGTWGEVQLERLLDQIFSPGQYLKNVCVREGSREQVEFAVRVAGREEDGNEMLLPIDSKCPVEDYERLLAALDANDPALAEQSAKQLETRLRACAKDIRDKYVNPPRTTSYGVMFLPSEGLFAEALRRPGLVESLQREFRVVIAGPTTLAAILTSVQMGIAINQITKRSTEVWRILGAVKLEFRKYGEAVDKVRGSLNAAANNLERVSTRSRVIERRLRGVEALPEGEASAILDEAGTDLGLEDGEEPAADEAAETVEQA